MKETVVVTLKQLFERLAEDPSLRHELYNFAHGAKHLYDLQCLGLTRLNIALSDQEVKIILVEQGVEMAEARQEARGTYCIKVLGGHDWTVAPALSVRGGEPYASVTCLKCGVSREVKLEMTVAEATNLLRDYENMRKMVLGGTL